jgi:hypothetical protein
VASPRFRRSDDVVFEVSGGRAVLLDQSGTELITLNPVGTLIWQALEHPSDVHTIAQQLNATFPDVPTEQLEADATSFLDELGASGLVVDDAAG